MPTWITPRRLGAAAVLYATFVGGWYLGQPLYPDCPTPGVAQAPQVHEPAELPLSSGTALVKDIATYEVIGTGYCDRYTTHPRVWAWLNGDWR